MASAVKQVNPGADIIGTKHALGMNIVAAKSLADIVKTNLGPRGTMKMLVGGAGQIKVTKDGKVLLDEMQIQHPTAAIIARTATAQEDMTGDGTTSNVLFTGALLAESERYLTEGLHPRLLVEGMELAREHTLKFLEDYKSPVPSGPLDRDTLVQVARTALRTKLHEEMADHLTEIVVDAVRTIEKANGVESTTLDLHMVEIMHMKHQSALDTKFIDGLVLDHGARHPDMPKRCENVHILILNVSLEYEKSEVNAGFFYKSADERSKLVAAERKFTDDKVLKIIEFKNKVLPDASKGTLMVINQKGIDPISLDMLQKAGIIGLRRAKKRNMERLSRACGGYAINAVDALEPDCLGFAKLAYEHSLGDDKFTFIEGCQNPSSCTILVKGPNEHTIRQILDAVHDGLRAVKNVIEDRALVPGAGAFELAAHLELHKFKSQVQGRAKIGVAAFADALLTIPKVLASNSGLDTQTVLIDLLDEAANNNRVGIDIETGKPILPEKLGVWDNYRVKKQLLHLGSLIAIKLLLVDEIMRAGRKMGKA